MISIGKERVVEVYASAQVIKHECFYKKYYESKLFHNVDGVRYLFARVILCIQVVFTARIEVKGHNLMLCTCNI